MREPFMAWKAFLRKTNAGRGLLFRTLFAFPREGIILAVEAYTDSLVMLNGREIGSRLLCSF